MAGPTDTRATIFIAEDNPILLHGLDRALSASGYAVETAASGEDLLQMLQEEERCPDLVLLDLMMSGIGGFEVLRTLQTRPNLKGLPVVLITAATEEGLRATAHEAGAVDLLVKPFRLRELLERIEAHVPPSQQD